MTTAAPALDLAEVFAPEYAPGDVALYLAALFAGRDDVYNTTTGAGAYVTVREALTPAVILAALARRQPVGAYFLGPDSAGHVIALDLDRPDGWDLARGLGSAMLAEGIPAYVERSRDGRAHLWVSIDARLPGIVLRRAALAFVDAEGLAGDPTLEVRPATDRLSTPDSVGHALRLPTMPHPTTARRHPLCDPRTGEPLGTSLSAMLLAVDQAPAELVRAAAERYQAPATEPAPRRPRPSAERGSSPIERFNATVGVSEVLAREFGVDRAASGRSVRCPAHDDRSPSLSIARDDSRAWCHSPACELYGPNGAGHDAYGLWTIARARAA